MSRPHTLRCRFRAAVVVALWASGALTIPARAAPIVAEAGVPSVLRLALGDESVSVTRGLVMVEDPGSRLTIEQLADDRETDHFVPQPNRVPNLGYSGSSYWFRLQITDTGSASREWLLVVDTFMVDEVDLYRAEEDGTFRRLSSGRSIPIRRRPIPHRYPVFSLGRLTAEPVTIYLRMQSSDVATFPIRVMTRDAFARRNHVEQLILGLYYGILLVMVVFNFFVFVYLKDATYLAYVVFIGSFCLFDASITGVALEYLWPESIRWNEMAVPVFCSATVVFGMVFSLRFLLLREYSALFRRLTQGFFAFGVFMIVMSLCGHVTLGGLLGSGFALMAVLAMLSMGIVALAKGYHPAGYYLAAGAAPFVGVTANALRNFGLLPTGFLTTYGNQMGAALEVIILSLALVARVSTAQKEKEQAQALMLQSQQVSIANLRRSMQFQLQALQARINPHFLFNTLNTIIGFIAEDPQRAEQLVIKLSRLFRYTLDATERERVALAEELAIVQSYLEIEQARFGKRLAFEVRRDGNVELVTLPGLTLQPLVENSIKHGLRSKLEGGKVLVSATVVAGRCHLVVQDNGVGMDPGKEHAGHGLNSVRERLRLAYGDRFDMRMFNQDGLRICLDLPVEQVT